MSRHGPFRLPDAPQRRLPEMRFAFDGRAMHGVEGDTLASALLASGVRIVARSMKFHRPRGVFSADVGEPNALLRLHSGAQTLVSVPATRAPLGRGLQSFAQSGWPSVRWDLGRMLDLIAPVWAAGFYNKTFMWPSWHLYEGAIRRMAGLGRLPTRPHRDPDRYETRNAHCDVLIVGGGVAALSAAAAAARTGARVILAGQGSEWGGAARDGTTIAGADGRQWIARVCAELQQAANVEMLPGTAVAGYYDHEVLTLVERPTDPRAPRERYWIVRTRRVVLATGAIEQPLVFCNNDRPGVMLAGAARVYLKRHGVAPGRRVVVATNNDSAYSVARSLRQSGVAVLAMVDSRATVPRALAAEMQALSIPLLTGSMPLDTVGARGLRQVSVGLVSLDGAAEGPHVTFDCDALLVSGGFSPALHLFSQAGGRLVYDDRLGALSPASVHPAIDIIGAAADPWMDADTAVQQGAIAGSQGGASSTPVPAPVPRVIGPRICPVGNKARQWVDLLHDVTVADLELALRENYTSIEHVKRYTTVGMSLDQGKTSNTATLGLVAAQRKLAGADLGHTTFRPPWTPVTFGAIAGRTVGPRFAPSRRTPMHAWHAQHGAVIEDFGEWKRAAAYVLPGESRAQATRREARGVRGGVGLFDASPLGKIEVQGPDALEFLNRLYLNDLTKLAPGRVRYALMLRESGVIFDDGTVVMLAPEHVLVTTTSGAAGRVSSWMEEWRQCEWPQWQLAITPVTDQWATISVSGPQARDVIRRLDLGVDFAPAAFPHMTLREGRFDGAPARIYRVSFSGELTYEVNVPASKGIALWEALRAAGASDNIAPYGVDALLLMRLEKGFLHIGTDTDGTTVPDDVGLGALAARKPQDFVGRRSLTLPENVRDDRLQLVGLVASDARDMPIGAHVRTADSTHASDGWVTSAGRRIEDETPIALAMIRAGRRRIGQTVTLHDVGRVTSAKITAPVFYDPAGKRMNA